MPSLWDNPAPVSGNRSTNGTLQKDAEQNDPANGELVEDIYYINSLNQTVIAAWELQTPDQLKKDVLTKRPECLSVWGADRRVKVSPEHFQPHGKYRAICKLFMGFSRNEGHNYIATGWLIAKDVVVTAGHCLYDTRNGYLKSVKAYIGYQGPEEQALQRNSCQMRLGSIAVTPAEYIKTSHTVHDVGFIKLERPFDDVEPFLPQDTPRSASGVRLGVVGYPGDLHSGNEMYEHWDTTDIDLSTNGYLNYRIDTEAGESGSPVLRDMGSGKLVPIGIHTDGGHPNAGSAIGAFGNLFSDYTTALKIKQTQQLSPGAKRVAAPEVRGTRNLEYISLPGTKEARNRPSEASPQGKESSLDDTHKPAGNNRVTSLWAPDKRTEAAETIRTLQGTTSQAGSSRNDGGTSLWASDKRTEAARAIQALEGTGSSQPVKPASGRADSRTPSRIPSTAQAQDKTPDQTDDGARKRKEAAKTVRFLEHGPEHNDPDREATEQILTKIKQQIQYRGKFPLPNANLHFERLQKESLRHFEMCTQSPEKLPVGAYAKENGGETNEELLRQANENLDTENEIKTTFFVTFPPKLTGEAKEKLTEVVQNVRDWQCWMYGLSAAKVQQQINAGKLPADATGIAEAKRSQYKNMVFDYVMRACNWVTQTYDEVQTKSVSCTKIELHTTLLKTVLEGFHVPGKIMGTLHSALDSIANGMLTVAKENKEQTMQYFIMLTRFEYESALETAQPVIRVISFRTDASLSRFTLAKSKVESADFNFTFRQCQFDFNNALFSQIKHNLGESTRAAGLEVMKMNASMIELEVDSVFKESMASRPRATQKQSAPVGGGGDYDSIVKSISHITDQGFCAEDSAAAVSEILAAGPFDAAIATLIGSRLALPGHQALKDLSIESQEGAIARFPPYWQLLGSMIFKQLFSSNGIPLCQEAVIPPALLFHDAVKALEDQLRKKTAAMDVIEENNRSLQFALNEARKKAESQEESIAKMTNTISVLRDLSRVHPVAPDQGNNPQTEPQPSQDQTDPVPKEDEPAMQDGESKATEPSEPVDSKSPPQANEPHPLENSMSAKLERLSRQLLQHDPSLKTLATEDINLTSRIDCESSKTSISLEHTQSFDVELSAKPNMMLGITELEYEGPAPDIGLSITRCSTNSFTMTATGSIAIKALQTRWLAYATTSPHIRMSTASLTAENLAPKQPPRYTTTLTPPFSASAKIQSHLFIRAIRFKDGTVDPVKFQPQVTNPTTNKFEWTLPDIRKSLAELQLGYFALNTLGGEKVCMGYVLDSAVKDRHPVTFKEGMFTRAPKVFLALNAFESTREPVKRLRAEVVKVDRNGMEVVTARAGFEYVNYLWVAMQVD
ncbi:hypothetical protein BO70DRAFT_422329 [Aspergillus heteromorphus CBS 117.55]|uniref:Peptidase S1 domain-containing protein n=1 Tax=Aspergillus heteromorphus CBS 117.55 TaxID=1448321 RepID=A0A317WK66_9EURO|nr:uncharacterized protein BO70DRAFT_422329 [Aspergillus heteromorphus CBS 117.55]PWY86719.1 hypothetical protein BO70DRAFT_422329 [Aspergillus heteromorphus CBS 117.55]